ncbi:hypothetical protein BH18VER1_BH18VER1_01590 [soil metagenome]
MRLKLLQVKTARFAAVVERCGTPEVYTLWQKPESDRRFQALLKNHRVMTIGQTNKGTDFGVVDFCKRKGVTYLVFPKSLKRFAEMRIVGIKWELIQS